MAVEEKQIKVIRTSPLFVKKMTSPWLRFRCLCPSSLWIKIGLATSSKPASVFLPKLLANSPWWKRLKWAWWQIETLNSCSRTGTPDVPTAQHGFNTSIEPLTTACSAPFPPTTYITRSINECKIMFLWLNLKIIITMIINIKGLFLNILSKWCFVQTILPSKPVLWWVALVLLTITSFS